MHRKCYPTAITRTCLINSRVSSFTRRFHSDAITHVKIRQCADIFGSFTTIRCGASNIHLAVVRAYPSLQLGPKSVSRRPSQQKGPKRRALRRPRVLLIPSRGRSRHPSPNMDQTDDFGSSKTSTMEPMSRRAFTFRRASASSSTMASATQLTQRRSYYPLSTWPFLTLKLANLLFTSTFPTDRTLTTTCPTHTTS